MASYNDLLSIAGQNSGLVQELYELYLKDPALVGKSWADLFSKVAPGTVEVKSATTPAVSYSGKTNGHVASGTISASDLVLQEKACRLINAYRKSGHLRAKINPLTKGIAPLPQCEDLEVSRYGFAVSDKAKEVACENLADHPSLPLGDVIEKLQSIYCGSIGFEYDHILNSEVKEWLRSRIENARRDYSLEEKLRAFKKLVQAEEFENQLHKKYVGQKRFSLQGGETLIPLLDILLESATKLGVSEVVMGKAHRGRLNVLVNTVGKPIEDLFNEFEDQSLYSVLGSGDVKYHKGSKSVFKGRNGNEVKVMLTPNPSHLEFVNPVVVGVARAKQDISYGSNRAQVLPVLMHGDAAFVGQGVVYETLNLSNVAGYTTGGTIHIVINNQIGFTTNPEDSRSSIYCTDFAKAIQAPIFHVNAEDVEASLWVAELALAFRQQFGHDAIIDLYCYRKYGHNEGDDPSFTQPLVYSEITQKKSIARLYGEKLASAGVLPADGVEKEFADYANYFQEAHRAKPAKVIGDACAMHGRLRVPTPPTGVERATLDKIGKTLTSFPSGFTPHPKLKTILEKRVQSLADGHGIDWGLAEALAYGSLMLEGHRVRLSGQDCGRGTFSHRHLALNNYEKPERFLPLSILNKEFGARGEFEVINSTLSEAAVLGYEFGYAATAQDALVMWEGQFGDFANGAQVHIDQFIASSESKWDQLSGLVMLLPHGMEGQGPEHSSARLERFLQLCAEGNMCVCYPSNASQIFHLLRRQGVMEIKRPLIVMTPKSLLRLPDACCNVGEITDGQFEPVISETIGEGPVRHVVLLTGKVYYDIANALRKAGGETTRLVRIEQLHPFPQFELKKALKDVTTSSILWVQEEPKNMGAWSYLESYLKEKLELQARFVGRPASASPACGSVKRHGVEQQKIIDEVLATVKGAK